MNSTKAILLLALSAALASGANARHLLQSESQTIRWYEPGNGNLGSISVPVNSSVTFSWTSLHDLWEIPSFSCPAEFTNGSGITQLSPQVSGGSRVVNYTTAGTRYYACSVSDHCSEGQLIAVNVGGSGPAPAPGPSSRYGRGYGGGSSCGGNSTSGSGYGGSSGSGSNYAGAPGTSAYGGGRSSNSTGSNSTSSSYGGGNAGYSGGGANYGGGSSSNYGSGEG